MTPSPDPQQRRRSLTGDELIAILVAFASLGTIFFWSIRQGDQGLDLSVLQSPTPSPTPTQPNPVVSPSVAAPATISASPQPAPTATPTAAPSGPAQATPFRVAPVPIPVGSQGSPTPAASPAGRATKFSDVPASFWASGYIAELVDRGIVDGFPDGTFRPDKPVTRAEFAEMLRRGFNKPAAREGLRFSDVPPDYWATDAINQSVQTGFLNGYPGGVFRPNQVIPRLQAQVALVSGLNLAPPASATQTLGQYQDAAEVPSWATDKVAAASGSGIVVNYPDSQKLRPNQVTTRAEATALVYRALQKEGKL